MGTTVLRQILLSLLLCILTPAIWLQSAPQESSQRILMLYKSRDANHQSHIAYIGNFVRQAGFEYDSRDIEKLLNEDVDLSGYSGIVTVYLSSQMVGGDRYPLWLIKQMQAGRPICIIGSYGAYQGLIIKPNGKFIEWNESTQTINTFFWPFGLEFYFAFTNKIDQFKVTRKVKEYSEFQAPLRPENINYYQLFRSVNPKNKIYLGVLRTDLVDSDSAFVVHTPYGGMVLEGYGFFWSEEKKKMLQRVNMPQFIRQALEQNFTLEPQYQVPSHADLVKDNPLPSKEPPKEETNYIDGEISRLVLVPYKKTEAPHLEGHPLSARAEIALNYLGVRLDYWPLEDGLPPEEMMRKYRGIITWHITPFMKNAKEYGNWLLRQMDAGKKVAILQEYGASIDIDSQVRVPQEAAIFQKLGIEYRKMPPPRVEQPLVIRVKDELMDFEHPVDTDYITYSSLFRSVDSQNTVHFSYQDVDYGAVDLVVTGPQGGVALETTPFYFPPGDPERRELVEKAIREEIQAEIAEQPTIGGWILDPYQFFTRALDLKEIPAPDYTTLNGARMFYTHIDGDGLDSISLIDKAHIAGKFIIDEVINKYTEFPHTISVISKLVHQAGNEWYNPAIQLSREIFQLSHVELASHSGTHPFDWVGGDPYVTNPGEYPYKIGYRPHNYLEEIWGSRLFIEKNLAPEGVTCDVMLWSGATNPPKKALEVTWRANMVNLNGGDPVFDKEHPSIASLAPVAVRQGPFHQYHSSAQNDYIYTLFLTGDWGGQKKLLDHFNKTGSPRRILPMNLYYHFYSGIKKKSLDALRYIFDNLQPQVKRGAVAPVYTSDYCRAAEAFNYSRIGKDKSGAWWIQNNGSLRTLRFKSLVHVDVSRSEGVLGYDQIQGETYVHLDGRPLRRVYLTDQPPTAPFLRRSTFFVDSMSSDNGSLQMEIRGLGWAVIKVGGLQASLSYRATLQNDNGQKFWEESLLANSQGEVNISRLLPAPRKSYTLNVKLEGDQS